MEKSPGYYEALIRRYLRNELPAGQVEEIFAWIEDNSEAFERSMDSEEMKRLLADSANVHNPGAEASARMKHRLLQEIQDDHDDATVTPVHRVHLLRRAWFRYAAAAIIILGLGTAYLWNYTQKEEPSLATTNPYPVNNDVAPGGNRATLQLADGRTIALDTAANGLLATQGKAKVRKAANGQIIYDAATVRNTEVLYNTMTTPRGGQYQLTLPDGSRVWLNAESSLRYPALFTGNERKVEVTGEAYFEVAHDAKRPFIVQTRTDRIEVLGTHFNVRTYEDEGPVKTSLLEGLVKVKTMPSEGSVFGASLVLKPGQACAGGTNVATNSEADIAWTKGIFQFNETPTDDVLRQLARWYDLHVNVGNEVKRKKITGKMSRQLKLSEVMMILQDLGVFCTLDDKRNLTVTLK